MCSLSWARGRGTRHDGERREPPQLQATLAIEAGDLGAVGRQADNRAVVARQPRHHAPGAPQVPHAHERRARVRRRELEAAAERDRGHAAGRVGEGGDGAAAAAVPQPYVRVGRAAGRHLVAEERDAHDAARVAAERGARDERLDGPQLDRAVVGARGGDARAGGEREDARDCACGRRTVGKTGQA
eukprot:6154019-Prymnesium_polylepis.1